MASVSQHNADRRLLAETPIASICPTYKSDKWATRIDIALLASALFLQRFSLPFGKSFVTLDFVAIALIFLHQFLSGRMLIQYDRLLWFLATVLAATCSLLLNFKSTMLSSYSLFLVLYSLFTLSKPSTPDRYKSTLQAFQFLVMLLSCLAVAQFFAQFVVDGRQVIIFYGIVPDFLFGFFHSGGEHTIIPVTYGSSVIKSNGIFLGEPSILSQTTALGILIEALEFGRRRYLFVMVLGFLVAYSGTGLMTLLLFLSLAGVRHRRVGLSALIIVMFALGLFATGIIDLSAFTSRVGEFEDTRASGFGRFVSPLWLTAKKFDTATIPELVAGSGPGSVHDLIDTWWGGLASTWYKLFYEYGMVGFFIFVCFLASCLKRSRCPGLVRAALMFTYTFLGDNFLTTPLLTIIVVLCTLHGPEPRRGRIEEAGRYGPSLVAGSPAG